MEQGGHQTSAASVAGAPLPGQGQAVLQALLSMLAVLQHPALRGLPSGPNVGTFGCVEPCARLTSGRQSGAKPGLPPEPKQEQEAKAAEAAKDVKGGGPGPNTAAGAEVKVLKASTKARTQMPPPSSGFLAKLAGTPGWPPHACPQEGLQDHRPNISHAPAQVPSVA